MHFVDSDDMITPDCIATCMEHIGENDIVWHDTIHLAEDGIIPDDEWHKNLLDFLELDEEDIRTPLPTIKLWKNLEKFHWVWGGVFRKKLCEKLRFSAQIRAQDALFGMILFAKAQSTLLITQKLYIYRLRANSTVDLAFSKSEPLKSYPAYMADIANTFNNNLKIKQYYFSYSIAYVCLGILAFIDTLPPSEKDIRDKLNVFISKYVDWAFGGLKLESDPRNLRTLLKPLKPYTKWVSSSKKLAYFAPYIFSILHTCKNILKRRF